MRLPDPCLVVLVGATAAGKSTWAAEWFAPEAVVSSDGLRAVVGRGERDQRAAKDAFEVLDLIVAKRLGRGLTTVVDSTGLDAKRRARWLGLAAEAGVPAVAVVVAEDEKVVRSRNRARSSPVPENVVCSQLAAMASVREALAGEAFAAVVDAGPVELVPAAFAGALDAAARQREDPRVLEFGLQISHFDVEGHPATTGATLVAMARAAEEAGFTSLWVMDHVLQIPQVGREWEDMLESYTTLASRRLARSPSRLAKRAAVASSGCRGDVAHPARDARHRHHLPQHRAPGQDRRRAGRARRRPGGVRAGRGVVQARARPLRVGLPAAGRALRAPRGRARAAAAGVGEGLAALRGGAVTVDAATCYPRPLQDRIPILVGGSGERKTLRLVARHADACNPFGGPARVAHLVGVLRAHCETEGRDPAAVRITNLVPARVIADGEERAGEGAATVEEHIGRYREYAEAGVQTAIVGLSDAGGAESVARFADVIAAFREP